MTVIPVPLVTWEKWFLPAIPTPFPSPKLSVRLFMGSQVLPSVLFFVVTHSLVEIVEKA